jgi:hypothetical protein
LKCRNDLFFKEDVVDQTGDPLAKVPAISPRVGFVRSAESGAIRSEDPLSAQNAPGGCARGNPNIRGALIRYPIISGSGA